VAKDADSAIFSEREENRRCIYENGIGRKGIVWSTSSGAEKIANASLKMHYQGSTEGTQVMVAEHQKSFH